LGYDLWRLFAVCVCLSSEDKCLRGSAAFSACPVRFAGLQVYVHAFEALLVWLAVFPVVSPPATHVQNGRHVMPLQPVQRVDPKRTKKKPKPTPAVEPLAYTLPEAAQASTFSLSTLYAAIRAGELRVTRAGRAVRILPSDLDAWLLSLRPETGR
jgi:excisionase family DNA binding protein